VTAEVSKDENERIDQYEKRFQQLLKCHVLGRYIMADEFWYVRLLSLVAR
jgi:hypothetical protein